MTDTCHKATKQRRLLSAAIKTAALDMGVPESEIKVYELDCWDHLRNIWLNQVNIVLSKTPMEALDEQVERFATNATHSHGYYSRRKLLEHKLDKAKEDYINAIYFYKQYHSKRCWLTVEQARLEWREIKTKIHIQLFGLGWKEALHPWSKEGYTYILLRNCLTT